MGVTWIEPVEITPGVVVAWTDVDISSYVPNGSTGVLLHVVNKYSGSDLQLGYRKNGSTDNRINSLTSLSHHWASCGIDNNRIIELYVGYTSSLMNVYLVGYFDSDAVFNTNAVDISLTTTSAWTDIDINVDDSAVGVFIEIVTSFSYAFGLRKNGSTDNRTISVNNRSYGFIGLDENEIFEGYIDSTRIDFYINGYIKSGAIFNTNATDLSLGSTGSYQDLSSLPSGSTGGFIEVLSTKYVNYALRKNGSTEDIYYRIYSHNWGAVECDATQIIEGKIANTAVDFFLTGYTTESTSLYTNVYIYDGLSWINPTAVKYYDGVSWVDITAINRSDGATWVTV